MVRVRLGVLKRPYTEAKPTPDAHRFNFCGLANLEAVGAYAGANDRQSR
jgi:hypothetical protein